MDKDKILTFVDHVGRFYAKQYGFSPVAGRLVGYISVCEPAEQTINDIADALLTSRSAINNAVKVLEAQRIVQRTRPAGSRADLISKSPLIKENMGFDPDEYLQTAALAREGLELLKAASPERREVLEITASLNEYMAKRLPELYEEWHAYYEKSHK